MRRELACSVLEAVIDAGVLKGAFVIFGGFHQHPLMNRCDSDLTRRFSMNAYVVTGKEHIQEEINRRL